MVEEMAAGGQTRIGMAKALGVAHTTFRLMREADPEIDEAVERGYDKMEHELVHALKERALDDSRKDASVCAMFLLKSRRGYQGDKVPRHLTVINNDNRQQLMLPSAQDMDDYRARLDDD